MGKKGNSTASRLVLQTLQGCSRTKKELKRVLKTSKSSIKKKHTEKALKALMASGKVNKCGKKYRLTIQREMASVSTSTATPEPILFSEKLEDQPGIPIGMRLRGKKGRSEFQVSDNSSYPYSRSDIDDEIARLEKELIDTMSESDDSGCSSSEDLTTNNNETTKLSFSSYADDRIKNLPSKCLPVPGGYCLRKKGESSKTSQPPRIKSGLQKAVEEVLGGYKARSSERIPFYCRFCSKQYENETTFYNHKASEFHKTAVELERKASYCKLCRKQFTSPVQMKEHLSSRPHKERLQNVRSRQQGQRRTR